MKTYYETQRLILRILTPEWHQEVLRFYTANQTIFQPYDPLLPPQYYTLEYQYRTLFFEYQNFKNRKGVRYYLFEKKNPTHIIGTISFTNIIYGFIGNAVLGYKLAQSFQHQGYALESMQKGIELMFSEEGLHRLSAYIMPNNLPSIRLVQRLNFEYEGTIREYAMIQGKWEDHHHYSLINHS